MMMIKMKEKVGDELVGCYSSPPLTKDLVSRSKSRTKMDTRNGDDLHAPKWPPSLNDATTEPS